MSRIELYGTVTSPYVRRVRILLHEFGLPYQLVNTAEEAGQARLRELNPVWKVPILRVDELLLLDSAVISRHLFDRFGPGELSHPVDPDLDVSNCSTVVDGALDALINLFYLSKEGVKRESVPYLQKQYDRAAACLCWIEARLRGPWLTERAQLGLPEIGLITALEWMRFRNAYPIADHPRLLEFLSHHDSRESIAITLPPA